MLQAEQVGFPTGTATGTSGQTINKPAGLLTTAPSLLAASNDPGAIIVPVETLALNNNLVTATSVIVASVATQCNDDTLVVVRESGQRGDILVHVANANCCPTIQP